MAVDSEDNADLGLIVGILAAAVVVVLALGLVPSFVGGTVDRDINVTVESPTKAPAPQG